MSRETSPSRALSTRLAAQKQRRDQESTRRGAIYGHAYWSLMHYCPRYSHLHVPVCRPSIFRKQSRFRLSARDWGLAQPFLILILEGAPLLSRLLRHCGDFDLHELRMPSQVPRPVPAKNAGTRTGQPLDLRFYLERMGQPPMSIFQTPGASLNSPLHIIFRLVVSTSTPCLKF